MPEYQGVAKAGGRHIVKWDFKHPFVVPIDCPINSYLHILSYYTHVYIPTLYIGPHRLAQTSIFDG